MKGKLKFIIVIFLNLILTLTNQVHGQETFIPSGIDKSAQSSRNINHPDGATLQDIKRASGFIFTRNADPNNDEGGKCSCTLMNNASQDKGTPYVLSSAHCFESYNIGDQAFAYLSFDYEMSDATTRGDKVVDSSISGVWRVNYEILVKDDKSDIALIRLINPNPDLLKNAYAAGWDNTVSQSIRSQISHPRHDHKKVYLNPATSELGFFTLKEKKAGTVIKRKAFYYDHINNWNGVNMRPEGGSSGGGEFSATNLLKAVQSQNSLESTSTYASAILNSWYSHLLATNPSLSQYLDPASSYLNAIPGGYLNDLEPVEGHFDLELASGASVATPTTSVNDPTQLDENVVKIDFGILNKFLQEEEAPEGFPSWLDASGIKGESIGESDVLLTLWYPDKGAVDGLYTERLIYGVHLDQNTAERPNNFGFKGNGWNCDNPPEGYPPCNRIPSGWLFPSTEGSNEIKTRLFRSLEDLAGDTDEILRVGNLPVVIRLQNLGNEPVTVKSISYPAEMPLNALQLFKPDEVRSRFKSYKYPKSRFNSETLHINSVEVTHGDHEKTIKTGNNGGYLNLVNHLHRIGPVATSFNENVGRNLSLKINLENPDNVNFSYRVWIDYFNKEVPGGKNEDLFTYDFVTDQPEIHEEELLAEGFNQTGNSIMITKKLPIYHDVLLKSGQKRMTRMRISVKEGAVPPVQFDQNGNGEVEDYLIEIVAPNCIDSEPFEYLAYATNVLPFCEEGNYLDSKNAMLYRGVFPAFETGVQENIQYAKTKTPLTNALGGRKFVSNINETVDGVQVDEDLMMDVYYPVRSPESSEFKSPLVIYIFGGGFVGGERNNRLAKETCEWLARKGYVVAAIDYRLGMDARDKELAKRAVLRAWQDSRAAVQYWRAKPDDPNDRWKVDTDRVYVLGHSAGGITSLHNAYLSYDKFLEELDLSNGFLKAAHPDYEVTYPKEDGSLAIAKAYDLTTHTTTVCLTADCDTPLSTGINAQANKAVSFAGALGKKEWATDDVLAMDIHHFSDGTVPYERGKPFGWIATVGGWTGLLDLPEMDGGFAIGQYLDATFTAGTEEGGDTYQEANHFKLQSLTEPFQAGLGNSLVVPFHYPQLAFETDITEVGEDSDGTKIAPEVMYLVDAFLTKDWETGVAARQYLEVAEESPDKEVQEEKVSSQSFSIFPNPAREEVNVIVDIPQSGPLDLHIVDMQGRTVYEMSEQHVQEGTQWIRLGNLNLPSGAYVLRLMTNGFERSERLIFR